jgi:hypothetical protein
VLPKGAFAFAHGPFWIPGDEAILFHGAPLPGEPCALWTVRLNDGAIERLNVPALAVCAHGSADTRLQRLVCDSPCGHRPSKQLEG